MSGSHPTNPGPAGASTTGKRWLRWLGFAVALGLLGASILYASRHGNFRPLLRADPLWLALLAVSVLISSIGVNGLMFWLVNKPYVDPARPLSLSAMLGLLGASALLNYTPIKAGLFGRIAYLKHRHGVSYRASVLIHMMLAGSLFAAQGVTAAATILRRGFDPWWPVLAIAGIAAAALVGAVVVRHLLPRRGDGEADASLVHSFTWTAAHLCVWIVLAMGTIFMTGVRWWLVCRIMDKPVDAESATLMAVVHTFATILPANGLGMREWLIGLLFGGSTPVDLVTIGLVDRAAEAAVLMVFGTMALVWLHRADPSALHSREVESELREQ